MHRPHWSGPHHHLGRTRRRSVVEVYRLNAGAPFTDDVRRCSVFTPRTNDDAGSGFGNREHGLASVAALAADDVVLHD